MPNPKKPARLYLKRPTDRPPFWIIIDGTRQTSTGCGEHDLEGADKALAKYLGERFRPNTGIRELAAIPVAEVLALYGSLIPADSPSRATKGYHIKALLGFWGNKALAEVKATNCRDYVDSRPVKASTARIELKTLQAAINVWHRESALPAVPQVTLPRANYRRERVLERSEVAAMLRACRVKRGPQNMPQIDGKHVARFIRLGLATGMRKSALCGLRWTPSIRSGHIDTERGIVYQRGAGVAETTKRKPPLKLAGKALSMVRRWKAADHAKAINSVISFRGAAVLDVDKAFAAIVKLAGIGNDITPHTLKHTHITWRLWSGEQPWEIAGTVGTDAVTIERVYGHYKQAERKKA
jgi:integrase